MYRCRSPAALESDLCVEAFVSLNNYAKQCEVQRALRDEYEADRAELGRLESEVSAARERLRRERAREDEERRAWFGRFRRGGLAYRSVARDEDGEGEGAGKTDAGAAGGQHREQEEGAKENSYPRVGRPPAQATRNAENGSTSKKSTAPWSLKRKDPYQTLDSTPRKAKVGSTSKTSPSTAGSLSAAETTGAAAEQQKPKKIKTISSCPRQSSETLTTEKPSKEQVSPDGVGPAQFAPPEASPHAPEPVAEITTGFKQYVDDAPAATTILEAEARCAQPSRQVYDAIRDVTRSLPARPPSPPAVPETTDPTVVDTACPSVLEVSPLPEPAAVQRAAVEPNQPLPRSLRAKAAGTSKPSPLIAGSVLAVETTGPATEQQKPRKIKIIIRQPQPAGEPLTAKKPKIILSSHFPPSTVTTDEDPTASVLDYDGYTSTDSTSCCRLHNHEWQLHQVKTRTFATNPKVTQYWHWVRNAKVIEHQVLGSVRPIKWSVFKKPYNFHLKLGDIQEVSFARGSTRVIVTHNERDGRDMRPRGNVMAQFKRVRTTKRFLTFLGRREGVKIAEVGA